MSESTHISIFTLVNSVRIILTKLGLVFFRMIEFFDSIIRLKTIIITMICIMAVFRCIECRWSSSVLTIDLMIEEAFLRIVRLLVLARLSLKSH